jgi:hypothetical protein
MGNPLDGCSVFAGVVATVSEVAVAAGAGVGMLAGVGLGPAADGVAVGTGADRVGMPVISRRVTVVTVPRVAPAEYALAALGVGVGVGAGVATTIGAAGVGRLSGAMIGPDVGVGRGLGRVDGGRLKRSRLGSVCGPLGVVCAAANAGSVAAAASHTLARLKTLDPFIPITPNRTYLNRRQTRRPAPLAHHLRRGERHDRQPHLARRLSATHDRHRRL